MCPDKNIPIEQRVENEAFRQRRKATRKRLSYLLLTALVMVVAVWVLREPLAKNDRLNFMEKYGAKLMAFKAMHARWPSAEHMETVDLYGRTISPSSVTYDPTRLPADSPEDTTVVAHTSLLTCRFIASGHAVLMLNGDVKWLSTAELNPLLTSREQRYNASHLQNPRPTIPQ